MTRNVLAANVQAFIAAQHMLPSNAPVVIAVSGGPDSLCLLYLLFELRATLGIELHVVHLDHMLRGAESAAEAAFVAATAQALGLPATVEAQDVGAMARLYGTNLYATGRQARYTLFAGVAAAIGAQAVAVAHTANDQAETVLLHLLRGAGPEGLRGIRPVIGWEEWSRWGGDQHVPPTISQGTTLGLPLLIRPLLASTRPEIEQYCAERGLEPRRDPSNENTQHTRSRIRYELLPSLIEYNPRIIEALGRTAAISTEEHSLIEELLDKQWPRLAHTRPGAIDFDGETWPALHPALQRAALRRAYLLLNGAETLGLEHIEQARALSTAGVGRWMELPGRLRLTIGYNRQITIGEAQQQAVPQLLDDVVPLTLPGRVWLQNGWVLEARVEEPHPLSDQWEIWLDQAALTQAGPLSLRRRQAGDRVRPAGGRGSRKIQDLLLDAKIPRALRDAWPLLTAGETIVWVPGVRSAQGFAAQPGNPAVWFRIHKPEQTDS